MASCIPKRVRPVTETSAIVGWIQSDSFRALWTSTAGQFKVLAAILCGTWRNHLQMLGLSQEECGSLWSPGQSCNAIGIGTGGMTGMCQRCGSRSHFAGRQVQPGYRAICWGQKQVFAACSKGGTGSHGTGTDLTRWEPGITTAASQT